MILEKFSKKIVLLVVVQMVFSGFLFAQEPCILVRRLSDRIRADIMRTGSDSIKFNLAPVSVNTTTNRVRVVNNPLFILDGEEIKSDDIRNLDPKEIHSFTVFKDQKAVDLYGVRGINGVILITTKTAHEKSKEPPLIIN